jgi:hypothetical protein
MADTGAKGGRDLVAQYAGHLANLLNGNDHLPPTAPTVEIRAFQLYERVSRGLAGNRRYVDGLVGLWAYPPPADADAAADFYFDAVLDRRIGRRPGKPSSADNLRALIQSAAAGPAAVADADAELSTWKAMVAGPARIRRFLERTALYELSNRILKCLDAANRPYAEVLRLGLCPRDWLAGDEEVGVNTLKAANAFLKALREAMGGEVGRRPTAPELEAAWAAAPVPGFAASADFARAPLGAAILTRVAGQDVTRLVSFGDVEAFVSAIEDEEDDALVGVDEALPLLERAVRSGAVAADEKALLAAILEGRPLADAMKSDLGLRRRLKTSFDGDLAAYVSDLSARVAAFVRSEAAGRP